jgi:hypothetical protein
MVHHHFLEAFSAQYLHAARLLPASSLLNEVNEDLYCPFE